MCAGLQGGAGQGGLPGPRHNEDMGKQCREAGTTCFPGREMKRLLGSNSSAESPSLITTQAVPLGGVGLVHLQLPKAPGSRPGVDGWVLVTIEQ